MKTQYQGNFDWHFRDEMRYLRSGWVPYLMLENLRRGKVGGYFHLFTPLRYNNPKGGLIDWCPWWHTLLTSLHLILRDVHEVPYANAGGWIRASRAGSILSMTNYSAWEEENSRIELWIYNARHDLTWGWSEDCKFKELFKLCISRNGSCIYVINLAIRRQVQEQMTP